jgi:hypothetical protein
MYICLYMLYSAWESILANSFTHVVFPFKQLMRIWMGRRRAGAENGKRRENANSILFHFQFPLWAILHLKLFHLLSPFLPTDYKYIYDFNNISIFLFFYQFHYFSMKCLVKSLLGFYCFAYLNNILIPRQATWYKDLPLKAGRAGFESRSLDNCYRFSYEVDPYSSKNSKSSVGTIFDPSNTFSSSQIGP